MDQQLEQTFITALEQNKDKLLRVCSVYSMDADDKKDLFQEALINIWEAMPSFRGKSSISTWMFRVTLNVCMRLQARQKKRDQFRKLDSITIENAIVEDTTPEEQELSDQLNKLRNCIRKLNDADKAVITLFLEGLAYKEISDVTGLTENNVAVKIKRIKSKLLTCINDSI